MFAPISGEIGFQFLVTFVLNLYLYEFVTKVTPPAGQERINFYFYLRYLLTIKKMLI